MNHLPSMLLSLVLTGSVALAQAPGPTVGRQARQRPLVLAGDTAEPVHELLLAAGVATTVVFSEAIDRDSVELPEREQRFRLADVGEQSLLLEPWKGPKPGEAWTVRVRFRGPGSPQAVTFLLRSHPTEVDALVEVRRPRSLEALEAELAAERERNAQLKQELEELKGRCEVSLPAALALAGLLDSRGVQATSFLAHPAPGDTSGLQVGKGTAFRATLWSLAVIQVINPPGEGTWLPLAAQLTRADGTPVDVLPPLLSRSRLGPGEDGILVLETREPVKSPEKQYRLEVQDSAGKRRLSIDGVKF